MVLASGGDLLPPLLLAPLLAHLAIGFLGHVLPGDTRDQHDAAALEVLREILLRMSLGLRHAGLPPCGVGKGTAGKVLPF